LNWNKSEAPLKEKEVNHLVIASIVNVFLTGMLIKSAWNGNDKAILLVIIFYPMLILANLVLWFVLGSKKNTHYKVYRVTTIALILLFLPVLIIATSR
jgi:hypothetical protein